MPQQTIPLPLAKMALKLTPPPVVARTTELAVDRIRRRHPKLFANLARLSRARVHLTPTDTPHRFALTLGDGNVRFWVLDAADKSPPDAAIAGSLEALISMLEGKEDGDTLFFSRELQVTGDTTVIVGLRNTLDREEINLMADLLSLFGPFAEPLGRVIDLADKIGENLFKRIRSKTT